MYLTYLFVSKELILSSTYVKCPKEAVGSTTGRPDQLSKNRYIFDSIYSYAI